MNTVYITVVGSNTLDVNTIIKLIKDEGFDIQLLAPNMSLNKIPYAGIIILGRFDNIIFEKAKTDLCDRIKEFGGNSEHIIVCGNISTNYQSRLRNNWNINKVVQPRAWTENAIAQRVLTALYGGFGIKSVDKLKLPNFDNEDLFLKCPTKYMDTTKTFNFIGPSQKMRRLFFDIKNKFSKTDEPVLILGETGTGKEFVATVIHTPEGNQEKMGNFFDLNIGEVEENLLTSELFGHKKGAFTDAKEDVRGLLEVSHLDTVFLDEIGDLPSHIQVKLLRVLNNRRFRRVGEHKTSIPFKGRLIFATHQDIEKMCSENKFREDFYYRIAGEIIRIETLKERTGDLELLAKEFYQVWKSESKIEKKLQLSQKNFDEIVDVCMFHNFPGNVRQYRAVLIRTFNESEKFQQFDFNKLKSELEADKNYQLSAQPAKENNTNLHTLSISVLFNSSQCKHRDFEKLVNKEYCKEIYRIAENIENFENLADKTRAFLYKYLTREERDKIKFTQRNSIGKSKVG